MKITSSIDLCLKNTMPGFLCFTRNLSKGSWICIAPHCEKLASEVLRYGSHSCYTANSPYPPLSTAGRFIEAVCDTETWHCDWSEVFSKRLQWIWSTQGKSYYQTKEVQIDTLFTRYGHWLVMWKKNWMYYVFPVAVLIQHLYQLVAT